MNRKLKIIILLLVNGVIIAAGNLLADCVIAKDFLDKNKSKIADLPRLIEMIDRNEEKDTAKKYLVDINLAVQELDRLVQEKKPDDAKCKIFHGLIETYSQDITQKAQLSRLARASAAIDLERQAGQTRLNLLAALREAVANNDLEEIKRIGGQIAALSKPKELNELLSQ